MSNKLPEISKEDDRIVNDWWLKYKKMKNLYVIRDHLVRFMDNYPHLVENLSLHWFFLFNHGSALYKAGKYELFVELLLRIRNEFPGVYVRNFGYYDSKLIFWYVAQGRIDEISPFFDWFKIDKRGECMDQLDSVANLLRSIDRSDVLYKEIAKDSNAYIFVDMKFNRFFSQYIEKPSTIDNITALRNELLTNGIDDEWLVDEKNIAEKIRRVKRPFTTWEVNIPKKRSQITDLYNRITDNFTYYLYLNTGISFDCADYFSETVLQYYEMIVSGDTRPKNIFCLDKKTFQENLLQYTWSIVGDHIYYLSQLNAFYLFAEYLETCGNMTAEQKTAFQEIVTETYQGYTERNEKPGPEMLSFKKFPLWDITD